MLRIARPLLLAALGLGLSACAGAPRRPPSADALSLVRTAAEQIGRPYRFGGRSPESGFDCSGLAWWVHRRHGIAIPRTAAKQFRGGRRVSRGRLVPGDLVFFSTYKRGASHVGIYSGDGSFIHAPKGGKRVSKTALSNPYWEKRYLGARRYW